MMPFESYQSTSNSSVASATVP